jgi:hypothetical protein
MGNQVEQGKEFFENIKVSKGLSLPELETYFFGESNISDFIVNGYSRSNFDELREEIYGASKDRMKFIKFIRLNSVVLMTIKDGDKNDTFWFEVEFFNEVKSWIPSLEEFKKRMLLMNINMIPRQF